MSLWMLAEARRIGQSPDPLVREYLASRKGRLWYHHLARFATGRVDRASLEPRANTRGRRAELLYYTAVLDNGEPQAIRRLLHGVLDTDMIMFYEYDMAKYWLSEGFSPAPRANAER